jgi:TRAP-type C4-dicarboxylate transport system permease small subunit
MKVLISLINKMSDYLGRISAGLILIISILLMFEVIMRYVIGKPLDWILDVTLLTQAAFAFLAASYVHKVGGHVSMNILTEYVNNKSRRWLSITSNILTTLGCVWMAFLSWNLFTKSYKIKEASYGVDIPLYPWKILVSVCIVLMSLQCLARLLEDIKASPDDFAEMKGGH